jgi:hypothetical protein
MAPSAAAANVASKSTVEQSIIGCPEFEGECDPLSVFNGRVPDFPPTDKVNDLWEVLWVRNSHRSKHIEYYELAGPHVVVFLSASAWRRRGRVSVRGRSCPRRKLEGNDDSI